MVRLGLERGWKGAAGAASTHMSAGRQHAWQDPLRKSLLNMWRVRAR